MSAFPFDAVIFDMDGVIVDTEYYYLGETAAFAKELGLNLTQEELNGQVGTSHQFFLHMLVDWFERAGKGHFTGEEALARWDEWAHKRPRDYQALINPGADSRAAAPWRSRGACQLVSHGQHRGSAQRMRAV